MENLFHLDISCVMVLFCNVIPRIMKREYEFEIKILFLPNLGVHVESQVNCFWICVNLQGSCSKFT